LSIVIERVDTVLWKKIVLPRLSWKSPGIRKSQREGAALSIDAGGRLPRHVGHNHGMAMDAGPRLGDYRVRLGIAKVSRRCGNCEGKWQTGHIRVDSVLLFYGELAAPPRRSGFSHAAVARGSFR